MANVVNGWLGYGSSIAAGTITEPADVNYSRRPVTLASFDRATLVDVVPGTVGPATTAWGTIGYIGIFDARVAGNLLLWLITSSPIQVQAGASITAPVGSLTMLFPELGSSSAARSWSTGAVVATTIDGRAVTVGVPLLLTRGVISAQAPAFGATISMASLPQAQPTVGTGQLWNNGGVISVA